MTAVRGADGEPSRFVAIQRDVSERQRSEEARGLLLEELDHRVKNLFAIASAMVSITARSSATIAEMRDALRGRLDALAAAHALVRPAIAGSGSAGSGADLATLAAQVVRPHLPAEAKDAAALNGPEVALGATAATSFALILHELATNAVKYGAFSDPDGRLTITWRREADRLVLDWDETAPSAAAAAPAAQGFGSRLARSSATGSLGGGISYDWRPVGPLIRIEASIDRLSL